MVKVKKSDKVYVYHPPITVGLAAALVKILGGPKYVLDVQDLWPHTLASTGMLNNASILKVIGILSRFVYRNAETVITQSNGFQTELVKMGVTKNQLVTIYNWCDESHLVVDQKVSKLKAKWCDQLVLVYCGNLGLWDLFNILGSLVILQEQVQNFKFVICGTGIDENNLVKK